MLSARLPSYTRPGRRLSVVLSTTHARCLHRLHPVTRSRSATAAKVERDGSRFPPRFGGVQASVINQAPILAGVDVHSAPSTRSRYDPVQDRPAVQPLIPATITMDPIVHTVFEPQTSTWQYVVADPSTKTAVIIDPVLDFDPARNAIVTKSADSLLTLVKQEGYTVSRVLETHAHADHLTAAKYLQDRLAKGGKKPEIGIGKRIGEVQQRFAKRYGIAKDEYEGAFDKLFDDDEPFRVGELEAKAVHLPGHTPDHMGYLIGENIFCGDSIFNSDVGSARCDFPGGNANDLLFTLPPTFKIYTGHDYPPKTPRSTPQACSTVAEQMEHNKHLKSGTLEDEFVRWRTERDEALAEPRLIHQALQVNIRAGRLPQDGLLHVPVRAEGGDEDGREVVSVDVTTIS